MTDRAAWALGAALLLSCAGHLYALTRTAPTHRTLPILTPVSLQDEARLRAGTSTGRGGTGRGGPGRGGEEAVALAAALMDEPIDSSLAPTLTRMRDTRADLLRQRDRRHALNTELMDVGVDVAAELSPEQWEWVLSHRDTIRARADAAVFDHLLEKLR